MEDASLLCELQQSHGDLNSMIVISDHVCAEYRQKGHPERPERILSTLDYLKSQKKLPIRWLSPGKVSNEQLLRAHSPGHLAQGAAPVADFDADTPAYPAIDSHTRRAAGGALTALAIATQEDGARPFSLFRPPGHHAERDRAMGFCYFNHIAVAALEARQMGFGRVAVFDFDVHHGNGTEEILFEVPGCAFFSVHQFPCYPGTGRESRGNCLNYTVPPGAPREFYRSQLQRALLDLESWKPDLIAVSAGFDAYSKDPLSDAALEIEDYNWLGERLASTRLPLFSLLEGGYSEDLPLLIGAYLKGLSSVS
jgi:acetoin utilization deacetylase AcuC-like enzyme